MINLKNILYEEKETRDAMTELYLIKRSHSIKIQHKFVIKISTCLKYVDIY